MNTGPSSVRCIVCGYPIQVALAIGQMLKCPHCGTTFLAPDEDGAADREETESAAEAGVVELGAVDASHATRSAPVLNALPLDTAPQSGMPSPSPELEEEDVEIADEPRTFALLPAVSAAACGIAVLAGVLAWMAWAGQDPHAPNTDLSGPPPSVSPDTALQIPVEIPFPVRYSPAASRAQRIGGVRVNVDRVSFAPLVAKTKGNEVVRTDGELFLIVRLRIENRSTRPIPYRSWYGGQFAYRQWQLAARLVDDSGRRWPIVVFEDAKSIRDHTPSAELEPRDHIYDVLVFEPPSASAFEEASSWKLFLPSLAIGYNGGFGFIIQAGDVETTAL